MVLDKYQKQIEHFRRQRHTCAASMQRPFISIEAKRAECEYLLFQKFRL
jgi:hypothetical protein